VSKIEEVNRERFISLYYEAIHEDDILDRFDHYIERRAYGSDLFSTLRFISPIGSRQESRGGQASRINDRSL